VSDSTRSDDDAQWGNEIDLLNGGGNKVKVPSARAR
jgi:hypothetical protein